ncbi:hypothetical protein SERLA73DRAFT_171968 [Serpula lacrymans var. lacrymans S7.3]|uniref:Uncharacterized protein n=1 Tax=Serpula lacrymans var. lacrymans (strain S7.3) TaxID=936435 RepID=F8QDH8_SERL3|nr:hypothetical protein SERLA73DRAFT_171968 [Serpula lacrymans var. lacrymans S7.3]
MPVNNCTVSTTPPGALHTSDRSDGIEIVMQAADNLQPDSVKFPSQQSLRSDENILHRKQNDIILPLLKAMEDQTKEARDEEEDAHLPVR